MPLARVALRIGDLIELFEDALVFLGRNTNTRIAHLDIAARPTPGAAIADPDRAFLGIAHGVREQVAQYAFEQHRIVMHDHRGRCDPQRQAFGRRLRAVLAADPFEQFRQPEMQTDHLGHTAFEPREIEHLVEQLIQRLDVINDVLGGLPMLQGRRGRVVERSRQQSDRMQRLAQIVARGRKKT